MRRAEAVLAAVLLLTLATPSRAADPFVVIVNPSVAGKAVHRQDLVALFLKRARWGDRSLARPVDQSGTSPVRRTFSESVLGMPVAEVLQYWQKAMFGTPPLRPPLVRTSDAEVVSFVASTEGAVGYVSAAATLPPSVKRLEIID
jgi:ABC-type phosphate transport system substrate-binding protein